MRIGSQPIATLDIAFVESPGRGLVYGGKMLDADHPREVVPALRAGLLGSSFRFAVVGSVQTRKKYPERSAENPERLPERTINRPVI